MTANPWDKFYWNDWENDPALKLCGLAAQGLWMRCLCICAKAEPKGYLLVAGRPLSPSDLGTLVGRPEDEVETLLSELASVGVFSRDRQGRIYSRRMLRDELRSRLAKKNGRYGGNPTLSNNRDIFTRVNPPDKPPDKPHEPLAREISNEISNSRTKSARRRVSYPGDFEIFWKGYPTDELMSKQKAFWAWQRLSPEEQASALAAVPAFVDYCRSHPDYRAVHAVRFLTESRYQGFARAAASAAEQVYVQRGTPAWQAWERFYLANQRKTPPVDAGGGWHFPSEFPPADQSAAA